MKLTIKWAEVLQKFVPRSRIGMFHKEHTRSTPLDPKLTFWCVSYYLGAFGTVWLPYKTRVGIFRNESIRSTTLDPKLMFWCVLYYLGAFGTA